MLVAEQIACSVATIATIATIGNELCYGHWPMAWGLGHRDRTLGRTCMNSCTLHKLVSVLCPPPPHHPASQGVKCRQHGRSSASSGHAVPCYARPGMVPLGGWAATALYSRLRSSANDTSMLHMGVFTATLSLKGCKPNAEKPGCTQVHMRGAITTSTMNCQQHGLTKTLFKKLAGCIQQRPASEGNHPSISLRKHTCSNARSNAVIRHCATHC